MANSDKNIIITPYVSGVTQPQIKFVGQGNDPIYLKVLDGVSGSGATSGAALSVEGSAGQLFSVVNRLGTGSIFSVNDISGIPLIDANANGNISLAGYFGNVGIGFTSPSTKLAVNGSATVTETVYCNSLYTTTIENSVYDGNFFVNTYAGSAYIGDWDSNENYARIIIDAGTDINLATPYGMLYMGDYISDNFGAYMSYDSTTGEFALKNNSYCVSDGGYRITANAINAQTGTTYTFIATDNGKIVTFNNGSAVTVTIPTGLPTGFNCTAIQLGAGQVGFTAASGLTMNSYGNQYRLIGQHASASIIEYTTDTVNLSGNLVV
jgi:hypothetical protein